MTSMTSVGFLVGLEKNPKNRPLVTTLINSFVISIIMKAFATLITLILCVSPSVSEIKRSFITHQTAVVCNCKPFCLVVKCYFRLQGHILIIPGNTENVYNTSDSIRLLVCASLCKQDLLKHLLIVSFQMLNKIVSEFNFTIVKQM